MNKDAMIAAMIFGGSGSGGSGLPAVTSADNGKVLDVANGAWGAGKADLQVTLTLDLTNWASISGTSDVTPQAIYEAYQAGKSISLRYKDASYELVGFVSSATESGSNYVVNAVLLRYTTSAVSAIASISTSGVIWSGKMIRIENPLPAVTSSDEGKVLGVDDFGQWRAQKSVLDVVYTVTGLPVDNVYPLSTSTPFTSILALIGKYPLQAVLTMPGEGTITLPLISYSDTSGSEFVAFSGVTQISGAWVIVQIAQHSNGASGAVIPISTAQMSYNSGTNTLAIVN